MRDWRDIGLGLGGNLGDPAATIVKALDLLMARGHMQMIRVSRTYRTPPWGSLDQPDFANACALASTNLSPHALLREVKAVETLLGRRPGERWGPRAIDVDILFYAGEVVEEDDLVIPHAELGKRAFVLVPLMEIAPDFVIGGRRIQAIISDLDTTMIVPWQIG